MASIPAEHRPRFARLIADAWSDPEVAARYEREPAALLAEYGIVLDSDREAPELPPAPGDVAVEDLGVSAGAAMATIGTVSCPGSCIGLS
jgi:putative thiazole/oxazole-modified microcin (TOMM)-like peptide